MFGWVVELCVLSLVGISISPVEERADRFVFILTACLSNHPVISLRISHSSPSFLHPLT